MNLVPGFGVMSALVFAAVIVSTDPIVVVGLFKELGAPKRLAVLVEGESLLNDGTAVVLFTLIVAVASGGHFTVGGATLDFIRVAGMGGLIGGGIGFLVSQVIQRVDDAMVEITLTDRPLPAGAGGRLSWLGVDGGRMVGRSTCAPLPCSSIASREPVEPTWPRHPGKYRKNAKSSHRARPRAQWPLVPVPAVVGEQEHEALP